MAIIKMGQTVLYRSIFDAVRDMLHDEAFDGHDQVMARYLKPDLLDSRRYGHQETAQAKW